MADIRELMSFLDNSPSCFHAIHNLKTRLESQGFKALGEGEAWALEEGGKYFVTRNGSAIIAFRLPEVKGEGFILSASHSDRPTFKVKENPELETAGQYLRLAVERYGGMLMAPWMDRPLSIAGRVMVESETGMEIRLVNLDKDLCMIPNVAIHMNRKANDGYTYNPAVDMIPLMGSMSTKGCFRKQLAEAAGCTEEQILGYDLYLYNREKAKIWGAEDEYISAQGLDDLQCAWATMEGLIAAKPGKGVQLCCVFDNEEVGSGTMQGADSNFLESVLKRICACTGMDYSRALANSFQVSADNAHALHPNHPEFSDPTNRPVINGGVVIKFNANQRYTTDGITSALFRTACKKAGVNVQTFCNRADLAGGSTLGNISTSHVSIPSVDVGLPQFAMHSPYETAGVKDAESLVKAMIEVYGMSIRSASSGLTLE
ncbi:MAG: M18 family aminopeptidase [Ruminococcaceae bacterium]|nr:M18 family aminopeptidase [Oscillospiraceae bacterium]